MNKREIGLLSAAIGLAGLSVAVACSSSSPDEPTAKPDGGGVLDAATGDTYAPNYDVDAAGHAATYTGIRLDNTRCLAGAHDIGDGGEIACRVLVFFSPERSCDAAGLSAAPAADTERLEDDYAANGAPLPSGNFCALGQLSGLTWPQDAGAGWSYVSNSCSGDGGCAQAICASSDFDAGATPYGAWLICP